MRMEDERFSQTVSGAGNHEVKALVLAAMSSKNLYRPIDLQNLVSPHGLTVRSTGLGYFCRDSLSPIGMVAAEAIDERQNRFGYTVTPFGLEFGRPLVGHLLEWSLHHPQSLLQVFGATHAPKGSEEGKRRASDSRIKLFYELGTNPKAQLQMKDLAHALNFADRSGFLQPHVASLAEAGFLQYSAIEKDQPYVTHRFNPDFEGTYKHREKEASLSDALVEMLAQEPDRDFTLKEAEETLRKSFKRYQGVSGLYNRMKVVLRHLARQGVTIPSKFSGGEQSSVTMTPDQKLAMTQLAELLDGLQEGDPKVLQQGARLADQIMSSDVKKRSLIEKAYQNSPGMNQTNTVDLQATILGIVSRQPGLDSSQVLEQLEQQGKRLSIARVRSVLKQMVETKVIQGEKYKTTYKFSL